MLVRRHEAAGFRTPKRPGRVAGALVVTSGGSVLGGTDAVVLDNPPNCRSAVRLDDDSDAPPPGRNDHSGHREEVVTSATESSQPDDAVTRPHRWLPDETEVVRTVSHAALPP